jgi:hypothetical protein
VNVAPAADAFAGLLIKDSILAVNVMFDIEIVGVRSIQRRSSASRRFDHSFPSPTYASGCSFGTWRGKRACGERKRMFKRL